MIEIRNAMRNDLEQIVQVENRCFSQADAATKEALASRIQYISDTFVAVQDDKIVGIINGPVIDQLYITDDLFRKVKENPAQGGYQSVLGLAVHPDYQRQGIGKKLMQRLEKEAKLKKRKAITLTCKAHYIKFYEQLGFLNHRESQSQHGGAVWFDMVKRM